MGLIKEAYSELFDKQIPYSSSLTYSGKFKGYNANIKLELGILGICLSKQWKKVSKDIQIGLIQELMVKLFKKKKNTVNMELYNIFLKKVHLTVPKTKKDLVLEASFLRVNERFFSGVLDIPNLEWNKSANRLGSYDYGTDTVTISSILREDLDLVDYVMYHELLHKKLKFKSKFGKTRAHTKLFRDREKVFPNHSVLEKRLNRVCRKNKLRNLFFRRDS